MWSLLCVKQLYLFHCPLFFASKNPCVLQNVFQSRNSTNKANNDQVWCNVSFSYFDCLISFLHLINIGALCFTDNSFLYCSQDDLARISTNKHLQNCSFLAWPASVPDDPHVRLRPDLGNSNGKLVWLQWGVHIHCLKAIQWQVNLIKFTFSSSLRTIVVSHVLLRMQAYCF